MDEIRIRPARRDDVQAIQSVARESWSDAYRDIIPANIQQRVLENWYSTAALTASVESPRSLFLVAETSAALVGFAHLERQANGSADLARIYILPAYQRHGVGDEFMRALFAGACKDRIIRITVSVAQQNKPARRFYERSGFSLSGERSIDLFGFSLQEVTYEQLLEP